MKKKQTKKSSETKLIITIALIAGIVYLGMQYWQYLLLFIGIMVVIFIILMVSSIKFRQYMLIKLRISKPTPEQSEKKNNNHTPKDNPEPVKPVVVEPAKIVSPPDLSKVKTADLIDELGKRGQIK